MLSDSALPKILLILLSNTLNVFRMDMQSFIRKFGAKAVRDLARRAKTSANYLYQFSGDGKTRQPSIPMAMRLIEQSGHVLTFRGLRPDVYELVKPEVMDELKQGDSTCEEPNAKEGNNRTTGAGNIAPITASNGGQIAPKGAERREAHCGAPAVING